MTISIKYFITDSNGNFIDWFNRTGVALLDIVGKQAVVYGGVGADAVFVQAWTSADLTELGTNADRVYLTGNFADYSQAVDPDTGVYTFTRLGGVGAQAEVVKVVASDEDDVLYFADGQVSLNVVNNPALIGGAGFQAIASVSGAGTPAEPAELGQPTTHTTPTKVFITDVNGVAVPMVPQVGQALKIFGGSGEDAVYVRAGTKVDATEMGTGNDRVYLTGNLADYTQSIDQDTGVYTFSRTIHGATEEVKVTLSDEDDVLSFADGHIVFNITRSDITFHDGNQFQSITALMLALPGTPGLQHDFTGNTPEAAADYLNDPANADDLPTLTQEQGQQVDADMLDLVSPAVFASLSPEFISGFSPAVFASLTEAQVAQLTNAQGAQIAAGQLADVAPALLDNFSPAFLAGLSADAVASLSAPQLEALNNASLLDNLSHPLTQAQLTALSAGVIDTAGEVALMNDVLAQAPDSINSINLEPLYTAVQAVQAQAAGTPGLTMAHLYDLGITGPGDTDPTTLTAAQQDAVLSAIAAAADDGADTSTLADLQGIVTAAATAMATIAAAANGPNANGPAPTLQDYQAIGAALVSAPALDSDIASQANSLALLNDVVMGLQANQVATVAQINALATTVNKLAAIAALELGETIDPAFKPSLADLRALGLTLDNATNVDAVLAELAASANNLGDVLSLSQLAALIASEAPTATPVVLNIDEDTSHQFSAADFGFADDADTPAHSLAAVIITALPMVGTLTLNGANVSVNQSIAAADLANLVYTPVANASGTAYAAISYRVRDTGGTLNNGQNTSDIATLTINVLPVNDVGNVSILGSVSEDETVTATVQDADGIVPGSISYVWKVGSTTVGTGPSYTITSGDVTQNLSVEVTYTDGMGNTVTESSTLVEVVGLNNNPGQISIVGTPRQGNTLVASITDADQVGQQVQYQWLANGQDIEGATGQTLVLSQAHVGQAIAVRAIYRDQLGTQENITSGNTTAVQNVNDAGSVTISGTATRGETLTASVADADGLANATITYQWKAAGVNIDGARGQGASLVLTSDEVGKAITVQVSYQDDGGTTENRTSSATASVAQGVNQPSLPGEFEFSTAVAEGNTVNVVYTGATDPDGPIWFTQIRWQRETAPDVWTELNTSTLNIPADQSWVGSSVRAVATVYQNGVGTEFFSDPMVVANTNDIGQVSIVGSVSTGSTLTAQVTDADGLDAGATITYVWKADGEVISGATGATLALDTAQQGKAITVEASYTDALGGVETSIASAPTALVSATNQPGTVEVTVSGGGSVREGATLQATVTDANGVPPSIFFQPSPISYQWFADGQIIANATSSTYTLQTSQIGKAITVRATYTDLSGTSETLLSTPTDPVINVNSAPTAVGVTLQTQTIEGLSYTFSPADFNMTDAQDTPANALLEVIFTMLPSSGGTLHFNGQLLGLDPITSTVAVSVSDIPNLVYTAGSSAEQIRFRVRDNGGTDNGGINTSTNIALQTLSNIAIATLSTERAAALTPAQLAQLATNGKLANLNTAVVAALNLDGLTQAQAGDVLDTLGDIRRALLTELQGQQMAQVSLAEVNDASISSLSAAFIAGLDNSISQFSDTQLQQLTTAQLNALSVAQWEQLSAPQIALLDPAALSLVALLNLEAAGQLSAVSDANGVTTLAAYVAAWDSTLVAALDGAFLADLANAGLLGSLSSPLSDVQWTTPQPTGLGLTQLGQGGLAINTSPSELSLFKDLWANTPELDVAGLQALATTVDAIAQAAARGDGATAGLQLSVAQLQALGFANVTEANLPSVLQALSQTANDASGVDTLAKLQTIVNDALDTSDEARTRINTAATDNTAGTLTATDFTEAGIVLGNGNQAVTASNLGMVQNYLNSTAIGSDQTDTLAEMQTLVNAIEMLRVGADGIADNDVTLSTDHIAALGLQATITTASQRSLLGAVADVASVGSLSTHAALTTVAEAVAAIHQQAALGTTGADVVTMAQLGSLGLTTGTVGEFDNQALTTLSPAQEAKVLAALRNLSTTAPALTSVEALQNIVTQALVPDLVFDNLRLSTDTGSHNQDFVTNVGAQSLLATLSREIGSGETLWLSTNGGASYTDITSAVTGTALNLTGLVLSGANSLQLATSTDAGTNKTVVRLQSYSIDTTAAVNNLSAIDISNDTGTVVGASSDFVTSAAAQTITATLNAPLAAGDLFYGSVDGGVTWTLLNSFVQNTSLTWQGATLLNGANTLRFKLVDLAGNETPGLASQAYVLDTVAPQMALSAVSMTASTQPTLSGTAVLAAGETLSVNLNGRTWNNVAVTSGSWSINTLTTRDSFGVLMGALGNNANANLTLTTTDTAGNSRVNVVSLRVDNAAPGTPTVTAVTGTFDDTPVISGTVAAALVSASGETLRVTLRDDQGNTLATWSNVATNGTTWSINTQTQLTDAGTLLGPLANATYTVQATVTDGLARSASSTATGNLVVNTALPDTAAPVLLSSTPSDSDAGMQQLGVHTMDANGLMVLQFDENIALGASGTITFTSSNGGATVVIDVANHGGALAVSNGLLTITPTGLTAGKRYSVQVSAGALTDTATTPNAWTGLSGSTALNFVVKNTDGTVPLEVGYGAPEVAMNGSFTPGDVNGDGLNDIIMSSGSTGAYIVWGNLQGTGVSMTTSYNNPALAVNWKLPTSWQQVTGIGDVDGDGKDDVLLTDAKANPPEALSTGISYVIYGGAVTANRTFSGNLNSNEGYRIVGQPKEELGQSMSALADFDGDGLSDFALMSDGRTTEGMTRVKVFYGANSALNLNLNYPPADLAERQMEINLFRGLSTDVLGNMSGIGDFNGDGKADMAIACKRVNNIQGAYIVWGRDDKLANLDLTNGSIAPQDGMRLYSSDSNIDVAAVLSVGELNGDARAEVGVLTRNKTTGMISLNIIWGHSNATDIDLAQPLGSLGHSIQIESSTQVENGHIKTTQAGDVNGDGYTDLLVTRSVAGTVDVIYGGDSLTTVTNLNAGAPTAGQGFRLEGVYTESGNKIRSTTALGDINGDGLADILVVDQTDRYHIVLGGTASMADAVIGSGTVNGTTGSEALVGSSGADTLVGGGGADRFFAGLGNDTIVLNASNTTTFTDGGEIAAIHGGGGYDTVRLEGSAALDTTVLGLGVTGATTGRVTGIEALDMATDAGANSLHTSAQDVAAVTAMNQIRLGQSADGRTWANTSGSPLETVTRYHQLVVDGGSADSLTLDDNGWAWVGTATATPAVGSPVTYRVLQHAGRAAQILVHPDVDVAPLLQAHSAQGPGTPLGATDTVALTFDTAIALGSTGQLTFANALGQTVLTIDMANPPANLASWVTVSGNTLTLTAALLAELPAGGAYSIGWSQGFVVDADGGNALPAAALQDSSLVVRTHSASPDTAAPLLESASVQDMDAGSVNMGLNVHTVGDDFYIEFDEKISLGQGSLRFVGVNGAPTVTIGQADLVVSSDTRITISGNALVAAGLQAGHAYALQWDAGFVLDAVGNPAAAQTDLTSFNFVTTNSQGNVLGAGRGYGSIMDYHGLGNEVKGIGDVNGDGIDDYAVGGWGYNEWAGSLYVVYGNPQRPGGVDLRDYPNMELPADVGFRVTAGNQWWWNLGGSSTGMDINADGYQDLLFTQDGTVFALFGGTSSMGTNLTGVVQNSDSSNPPPNYLSKVGSNGAVVTLQGPNFYGWPVLNSVGDVNGDGYADLAVHLPGVQTPSVFVVYGGPDFVSTTISSSNFSAGQHFYTSGTDNGATVQSLSGVGDLNGDGRDDLLLTTGLTNGYAPISSNGYVSTSPGKAYLVWGSERSTALHINPTMASSDGITITGKVGQLFSHADAVGDWDGDGKSEIALYSVNWDGSTATPTKKVQVLWSHSLTSNIDLSSGTVPANMGFTISNLGNFLGGQNANQVVSEVWGDATAGGGDLNGDGISDYAFLGADVGSSRPYVQVIYGGAQLSDMDMATAPSGSQGVRINLPSESDVVDANYAQAVAWAGDVNGDGMDDLLIGNVNATFDGRTHSGRYHLVLGGTLTQEAAVRGAGTVLGNLASEAVIGSAGNDILVGNGGSDRFFAGAGDDVIVITASDVAALQTPVGTVRALADGGAGFDTLRLEGTSLDLTTISNAGGLNERKRLQNLEAIDMRTDAGANTLTLSGDDIVSMVPAAGGAPTLRVLAGANDVVVIDTTGWVQQANQTEGTETYAVWRDGVTGAVLMVSSAASVQTTLQNAAAPRLAADWVSVTGGTGTEGAFVEGDVVSISWDNSASGNNSAGVTSATVQLWGQTVTLTDANSDGIWTATLAVDDLGTRNNASSRAVLSATNPWGSASATSAQAWVVDTAAPVGLSTASTALSANLLRDGLSGSTLNFISEYRGVQNVAIQFNAAEAPDGSLTAEQVTTTGTSGSSVRNEPIAIGTGGMFTASAYVQKSSLNDWVQLRLTSDVSTGIYTGVSFNLVDGSRVDHRNSLSNGWAPVSANLEDVGNGWYRVSLTVDVTSSAAAAASSRARVWLFGSDTGVSNNALHSFGSVSKVWGLQVQSGEGATGIQASAAPAPALVFTGSTAEGMNSSRLAEASDIDAVELLRGVGVQVNLSNVASQIVSGDILQVIAGNRVVGTANVSSTSRLVNVNLTDLALVGDGPIQLSARLVDAAGHVNNNASLALTVNINTSVDDVVYGMGTDEVIRTGGGDDTVHLGTGGSDTLRYRQETGGNGQDTVHGFSFASTAMGGDRIDVTGLLSGFVASDTNSDGSISAAERAAQLQAGGYLRWANEGADLALWVDQDGTAGPAVAERLALFKGQQLSQVGSASTSEQATAHLLASGQLLMRESHLQVNGGSGAQGAFVSGDTATLSWDNSASGHNDTSVTAVTVQLWGQSVELTDANSDGVWTGTLATSSLPANTSARSEPLLQLTHTAGHSTTILADDQSLLVDLQGPASLAALSPSLVNNIIKNATMDGVTTSWGLTRVGVAVNTATAPDGTQQADAITVNAVNTSGSAIHQTNLLFPDAGGFYTYSVYLKHVSGAPIVTLQMGDGSNGYIRQYINLATGEILGKQQAAASGRTDYDIVPGTVRLEDAGNGWYRASMSVQATGNALVGSSVGAAHVYVSQPAENNFANVALGDRVDVWGLQVNTGVGVTGLFSTDTIDTGFSGNVLTEGSPTNAVDATELIRGFGVQVNLASVAANIQPGDVLEILAGGQVVGSTSVSTSSRLVNVALDELAKVGDGTITLTARLRDVAGNVGTASATGLSVNVNTSAADTLYGLNTDDHIRGGGGNDTIHLGTGGSDTLYYGYETPGNDTVHGFTVGAKAAGGDVIDLGDHLQHFVYDANASAATTAQALIDGGYLSLQEVGADLVVLADMDGNASSTSGMGALITLKGVQLADLDSSGSPTELGALQAMLASGQLVVAPRSAPDTTGAVSAEAVTFEAAQNLMPQSSAINSWTPSLTTVAPASVAAPDGTLTAFRVEALNSGATSYNAVNRSFGNLTANTSYTASLYVKADMSTAADFFTFRINIGDGDIYVVANLLTGTLTGPGGARAAAVTARSITAVDNGWYKLDMQFTTDGDVGVGVPSFNLIVGNYDGTPDNGEVVYLWRPQVTQSQEALPYIANAATTAGNAFHASSAGGVALTAAELAAGVVLRVDLTGITAAAGDVLQVIDGSGNVVGQQILLPGSTGVQTVVVSNTANGVLTDGVHALRVRLADLAGNPVGTASTATLSVTVNTITAETIHGTGGNDVIRGGGGNDTIVLTAGGSDTLVYGYEAPGHDTVHGFTVGSVLLDGGDVIDLGDHLQHFVYDANASAATTAQALIDGGYLSLQEMGADLVVLADMDGNAHSMMDMGALITLKGVQLADLDSSGSPSELGALQALLASGQLVVAPRLAPDTTDPSSLSSGPALTAVTNLLTHTDAPQQSIWTKTGVTVLPEVTAANGATGIDVLQENTQVNFQHRLQYGVASVLQLGTTYTLSAEVKLIAGTRDFQLGLTTTLATRVYFDLDTGTVVTESNATGKVVDLGGGWYRVSLTTTVAASGSLTGANAFLAMTNGTALGSETYTGDGTSQIAVGRVQLETGAEASPYILRGATSGTTLDDNLSSSDMANGWAVNANLTGVTIGQAERLEVVDQNDVIWGYTNLVAGPGGVVKVNLVQDASNAVVDGAYTLYTRLADYAGNRGELSSAGLSVTVNTSAAETIGSTNGNDVIRGGGGNDTIYLTPGGNDTLVYAPVAGQSAAGALGNGSDTVHGFSFGSMLLAGGDRLDLSGLFTGFVPTDTDSSGDVSAAEVAAQLVAGGFVSLANNGANLELSVDHDGTAGAAASSEVMVTFVNAQLADIGAATTATDALTQLFHQGQFVI